MSTIDPALIATVEDLHVSFAGREGVVQALRGVSLEIRRGEVLALVGESGSGKSVLGSCLLGLPPEARTTTAGTVTVDGTDMLRGRTADRREVRRHLLGGVFQDPLSSLNPTMRIEAQLRERGADRDRAIEALTEVGVPQPDARMRQWPHQLSGGLRQRVMLAMALATDGCRPEVTSRRPGGVRRRAHRGFAAVSAAPAGAMPVVPEDALAVVRDRSGGPLLIIADEPTTALDVSVQAQIVQLFDRLRREHGCAVLLITHDLGVAASIADRIAVLYAGRICEIGPAAEVLIAPRHPYTAGLLEARLTIDGLAQPVAIPGSPPNPLAPPPGCAFAPRCARATEQCSTVVPDALPIDGDGAGDAGAHLLACFHPVDHDRQVTAHRVHVRDTPERGSTCASPAVVGTPAPRDLQPIALTLNGLSKSFPPARRGGERLHAVSEVVMSVPVGGSVALVGESGCGKTTLLRMATGLLRPDEGHVWWAPDSGRPQLIFQDAGASLTPWMTVGRQVRERLAAVGVPRAERDDRTAELLARVGLDRRASQSRPRQLSGGQRQRAAIARSLASSPKVLVCDEPVSALDASLSVRVLDLLAELRETTGIALLVVTHDLAAARRIADEVAVMYLGRIVEQAPTDELFDDPRHPYTQGLLAASPTAEPGRLAPTLAGEPPSAYGPAAGCAFAPRCPLVVDRCLVERPHLIALRDGHRRAACHLA